MNELMTIEEFVRYEDPPGHRSELVRGTIVLHPFSTVSRGITATNIGCMLAAVVGRGAESKGWLTARTGVILQRNPDTLLGPDIAFWNIAREPLLHDGYFESLPDLVVEIVSTDEERDQIGERIADYVSSGAKILWIVDPEIRIVTVYTGSMRGTELDENETITGGDVLPEFSCKVSAFFE